MRAYGLLLCVGCVFGAGWIAPMYGPADEIDTGRLPPPHAGQVDYLRDIQPILQRTCYSCHGKEQQEAGLRLDDKQRALEGGDNGKAIVAGQSAESRLIQLVAGLDTDAGRMPPEGEGTPLTPEQIGLLRAWIDQGVSWPDGAAGSVGAGKLAWWSLSPAEVRPLPAVRDVSWVQNPIDSFILARLEQEKLVPSPPAHPATLLRRLYLDLLGMTPD
ncbi:MAG: c-type cytochrome domain-containing protein, partial [Pirellulaceae bacterium]